MLKRLYNRIYAYVLQQWQMYHDLKNGVYQRRPCVYCRKKFLFKIEKCGCGNDWCTNEGVCVCDKCDKLHDQENVYLEKGSPVTGEAKMYISDLKRPEILN